MHYCSKNFVININKIRNSIFEEKKIEEPYSIEGENEENERKGDSSFADFSTEMTMT